MFAVLPGFRIRFLHLFCFVLLGNAFVCLAHAQGSRGYVDKLKEANSDYNNGDFEKSIALLNDCLKASDFPDSLKASVYELLSKNYLGSSLVESAKTSIRQLLRLVPKYAPPHGNPELAALVEATRKEMPPPTISIVKPSSASLWLTETKDTIRWTSENVSGNVVLKLSTDGGKSYSTTLTSTAGGTGMYIVDVPAKVSGTARLRIESSTDSAVASESEMFSIAARSINVVLPRAGTTWIAGSLDSVKWTSVHVKERVNIKLSTDGGSTFPVVLASFAENDGNELVKVPDIEAGLCRVKVESATDTKLFGVSSTNFTVDSESTFPKTWHYIVGGIAVAGGVAAAILLGKKDEATRNPLPGPPARPTGQ